MRSSDVPAVGVQGHVGLLLQIPQVQIYGLVLNPQLFEDDGHLPRVGPAVVRVEGNWLRHAEIVASVSLLGLKGQVVVIENGMP